MGAPVAVLTVEFLLRHARELVYAESSASLDQIEQLMEGAEVSMIPIVDHGRRQNVGVVKRKSIWRRRRRDLPCDAQEHVREHRLDEVSPDDRLDRAMDKLRSARAVRPARA